MAKRRRYPPRLAFARRRQELGVSQPTVAVRAGVDKGTISRLERGVGMPPNEERPHLAEAYGFSLAEFNELLVPAGDDQASALAPSAVDATCSEVLAAVQQAGGESLASTSQDELLQLATPLLTHCAHGVLDVASPRRPGRVCLPEVQRVEAVTEALRALDSRFGGGACRGAIIGHVKQAEELLAQAQDDQVRDGLLLALADLNGLAGWVAFDTGDYREALSCLGRSLEQAQHLGDHSLVASALYSVGRVYLHCQLPRPALRFLQLGVIAAQDSRCKQTTALLLANEAWAHGALGNEVAVEVAIRRAEDAFGGVEGSTVQPWVRFFTEGDLYALGGYAYAALEQPSAKAHEQAIVLLAKAAQHRGPDRARSRMFNLSALAAAQFAGGDARAGVEAGAEALALAPALCSVRVAGRLDAVRRAALPHQGTSGVKDLLVALSRGNATDTL